LLFHDRFDPTTTLAQLRMPKLMLYSDTAGRYYDHAADPKQKATFAGYGDKNYPALLRGFLSKYLAGR
jgi:hypothetical protein